MTPRVSVVVPVHNAAPYLEDAVESVLRQSLADFELVCADDGSDDGSGAILERFARRDRRVRVLRPGRIGLIRAANLLRAEARAPVLARFDADDRMHPERLERQMEILGSGFDIVGSRVRHFPDDAVGEGEGGYAPPPPSARRAAAAAPSRRPARSSRSPRRRDTCVPSGASTRPAP